MLPIASPSSSPAPSSAATGAARAKRPRSASPEEAAGSHRRPRQDPSSLDTHFEQALQQGVTCLSKGDATGAVCSLSHIVDAPAAATSESFNGCWALANHEMARSLMRVHQLGATVLRSGAPGSAHDAPFLCERLGHHLAALKGATRSLELLARPAQRPEWLARYGAATLGTYEQDLTHVIREALTDAERVFDKVAALGETRSYVAHYRSMLFAQTANGLERLASMQREAEEDPWYPAVAEATQGLHQAATHQPPRIFWSFWLTHQQIHWSQRPEVSAAKKLLRAALPAR